MTDVELTGTRVKMRTNYTKNIALRTIYFYW